MPYLPLSALLVGLAAVCHSAWAGLDEEHDALRRSVLWSLGGNTAE